MLRKIWFVVTKKMLAFRTKHFFYFCNRETSYLCIPFSIKRMKTIITILLILLTWSVFTPAKAQGGVHFFKGSWDELVTEARKTGKPYFIDFWAVWCGPCKMMNNTTFKDGKVGEVANRYFIPYKLDVDHGDGKMLAGKYNISSIPTIMFFDADGKILGREMGFQPAEQFIQTMEKYISKKSLKKGGKEKTTGSATFKDYMELKKVELERLHAEMIGADTALQSQLKQAYDFGKRKEDLLFEDLKADSKIPEAQKWMLDAEYALGTGNFKLLTAYLHPLFEQKKLSDAALHYWAAQYLHDTDSDEIPHEPMKWINQVARNQPNNLSVLDTKIALLLKDKKVQQANEIVKQLEKQFKNNPPTDEATPLKINMELVKAQANS